MSGLKKSLRIPSSPKADFLYSTFDQLAADSQRNRSNSEASSARKGLTKPKKVTTDRSGLRRHTTEKAEILEKLTPRPSSKPPLWETQICEQDEDSPPKSSSDKFAFTFSPRSMKKTEWSERLFFRRRPESVRRNLVILCFSGVMCVTQPISPEKSYRSHMAQGLSLLKQHYQIAVLLRPQDDYTEAHRLLSESVDAIYVSRSTESIGSGRRVWMQNYSQLVSDFDATFSKTIVTPTQVACSLSLSPDEYDNKEFPALVAEPFNGNWQFHV